MMRRSVLGPCLCVLLVGAMAAPAQELTVETAPPVVVKTVPQAGATEVDPGLAEIRVTFSKAMDPGGMSIVQATRPTMPKITGKVSFDKEKRTCIVPAKLVPGRSYALWFNTERFGNFTDTEGRSAVPYLLVFETKGTKAAAAFSRDLLAAAYDALGEDMALHYSDFDLKRSDWPALRERYRAKAIAARSEREFAGVLRDLLRELRDGHVWIIASGEELSTYAVPRPPDNVNRRATLAALRNATECGAFAVVGTTRADGYAAVILTNQSAGDSETARQVVDFIRKAKDAPGFLIDLRTANGGNERLAAEIAREFCAKETVYARSRYRDGPRPSDFGKPYERLLKPSAHPYTKPVVCLIGPGCVSSGEGFAEMLKCLPQVTLVGAPTRGSSGNPRPFALPGLDVVVWYSRWVDMLPDGTPIEGRGITPDVPVEHSAAHSATGDPTWEKAIEVLRKRVANAGG